MEKRLIKLSLCAALVTLWSTASWAVNTVTVGSQALNGGETGVEVGVMLVNDITLRTVVMPLSIRTVQGGAFITSLKLGYGDRLPRTGGPLAEIAVSNLYTAEDGSCLDGLPGGFGTIVFNDTLPFAVSTSPVGAFLTRAKIFSAGLAPGADVTGSFRIEFDANSAQGIFEIDSSCADPANHLLYIEDITNNGSVPEFTKGVFTIGNPPVARDTSWSTNENTAKAVSYLPASDPDGNPLQFSITAGPEHGAISGFDTNTGAFLYTPDTPYFGPDSLSFEATDGGFISNTGKVRITVVDVNDPPVALDTAIVTDEDTPVDAQLQAYDNDSPTLTYIRLAGPSHGTITAFNSATGEFTYDPDPDYFGPDAMTFRVNDGSLNSNSASVSITVNPINDPPVARDTSVAVPFESLVNATFQAFDIDGPALTFAKVDGPFNGTFSGFDANTGAFTYTPDSAYFGPDSILFTADDGFGPSNVGTVRISVSSSDCVCACWGDPVCDGETNVLDVVRVIQIVFENHMPSVSPKCQSPDADFNCDCFHDVLDLSKVVDIVFFGDEDLCDPCGAGCFPGK